MTGTLVFCCDDDNDLHRAVSDGGGRYARVADPVQAVAAAAPGDAVLVLADGYPERPTVVPPGLLDVAAERGVRVLVECPDAVPGVAFGPDREAEWERLVVTGDAFGPELPDRTVLAAHAFRYRPATAGRTLLAVARVAGYDTAVFGVPEDAAAALLELPDTGTLVATTALSRFRTGRYAPVTGWTALWQAILGRLLAGAEGTGSPTTPPVLRWTPLVTPALRSGDPVGPAEERAAVARARSWHLDGGVLLSADGERASRAWLAAGGEAVHPGDLPPRDGDGSHGLLEGFESAVRADGRQRCRVPLRADSVAETAMVLALAADDPAVPDDRAATVAGNLLGYLFEGSGMCGGERADPGHPAYGLIAWGAGYVDWEKANYGDDNARAILAALAAARVLGTDRWTPRLLLATLANLRTTGVNGFRGDRIDLPELTRDGWRHYRDRDVVNVAPHFESYLWACYAWAYRVTGRPEFLACLRRGIANTMAAYPDGWRRRDTTERARMLLALAWLVRVDDTPEHRGWLAAVARDLLAGQQPSGALPESELGGPGLFHVPHTNEEYGRSESPLIQATGDPASDQLYTTGFALAGLHEAVAATGDADLARAEDRLAAYLVRIQTRSADPSLDGTWLRAFDFERWDYWASSGDMGWGAWCVELGWAPAWAAATLALRSRGTSLWDEVVQVVPEAGAGAELCAEMLDQD